MLTDTDKIIVRCWSIVRDRGEDGHHEQVRAEMEKSVAPSMMPDVELRMRALRAIGALP